MTKEEKVEKIEQLKCEILQEIKLKLEEHQKNKDEIKTEVTNIVHLIKSLKNSIE
jgi:hypothetical protein